MQPALELSAASVVEIINRRSRPFVVILNRELEVVCAEPRALEYLGSAYPGSLLEHALPDPVRDRIAASLKTNEARRETETSLILAFGGVSLRVVPMEGSNEYFLTLLVEPLAQRDYLRRAASHYSLTRRESEVLSHMLQGSGPIEIAEALAISRSTVKDHVKNLMKKTDARTRAEMLVKVYDVRD